MDCLVTSPHRLRQRIRAKTLPSGQTRRGDQGLHRRALYLQWRSADPCCCCRQHGLDVAYVQAAIVLLKADNASLVSDVLAGRVSILQAARSARRLVDLVTAYRKAKDSGSRRIRSGLRGRGDL